MAERHVVNKPKKVEGAENITVAEPEKPTVEQRLAAIEKYIISMDPHVKNTITEFNGLKPRIDNLDAEITRIAGIQARANNYIDAKFTSIDENIRSVAYLVKVLEDQFKALMSDEDIEGLEEEEPPEDVTEEPKK